MQSCLHRRPFGNNSTEVLRHLHPRSQLTPVEEALPPLHNPADQPVEHSNHALLSDLSSKGPCHKAY